MTDIQALDGVEAPLTYTLQKTEKLVYQVTEMGEGEDAPQYHDWYNTHAMRISDARPLAPDLSLDREGFILRHSPSAVRDFYDNDEVKAVYEPEIDRLVRETTGAEATVIFDHTIRVDSDDMRRARKVRETVMLAHNDYTDKSGPQRVRDLLPAAEAEQRLRGRFAIFGLWRPITGPVLSAPLAICDARTVSPKKLVLCDLQYEDRVGEIYNLAHDPDHRWFYVPRMISDEILIFKSYDSATDGRARFTPHTAFVDPTTPDDAPPRQSIETRLLAFFPPGD